MKSVVLLTHLVTIVESGKIIFSRASLIRIDGVDALSYDPAIAPDVLWLHLPILPNEGTLPSSPGALAQIRIDGRKSTVALGGAGAPNITLSRVANELVISGKLKRGAGVSVSECATAALQPDGPAAAPPSSLTNVARLEFNEDAAAVHTYIAFGNEPGAPAFVKRAGERALRVIGSVRVANGDGESVIADCSAPPASPTPPPPSPSPPPLSPPPRCTLPNGLPCTECSSSGGTAFVDPSDGTGLCRFEQSSCPPGFVPFRDWVAHGAASCSIPRFSTRFCGDGFRVCGGGSCTVDSRPFSAGPQSHCTIPNGEGFACNFVNCPHHGVSSFPNGCCTRSARCTPTSSLSILSIGCIQTPALGHQLAKLTAPDAEVGDHFGRSVATSGSLIVVGAPADDDSGSQSGSAYLYGMSGGLIAKLTASDAAAKDEFGISVAISNSAVVVGASGVASKSGAAYIFDTNGNQLLKLVAPDAATNDFFGRSVAISVSTIVVGAYGDDDGGASSGSVYVFNTAGTMLKKLIASDAGSFDSFGFSVAISNSLIVVGAKGDDDGGSSAGAAYVFDTSGNQISKLVARDSAAFDAFGTDVAISGSVIVVSSHKDDDAGSGSGAAYLFNTAGTQLTKLTASDARASDFFGASVAISGSTVVVGSYGDDDGGSSSGSAYVFDTNGNALTKITALDAEAADRFGDKVAVGSDGIVVGAYLSDDAGSSSGSAYVYVGPS